MAHATLREGVEEYVVVRDRALLVVLRTHVRCGEQHDKGERGEMVNVSV